MAGGASIGINFNFFFGWLFDLDVGLFANWPLGILISLLYLVVIKPKKMGKVWNSFLIIYLFIILFAQSSTTNLNSGATISVARYATWYIPLFFPYLYCLVKNSMENIVKFILFAIISFMFLLQSVYWYRPSYYEEYNTPTRVSILVHKHLGFLYDSPPEIFAPRYSNKGQHVLTMSPGFIFDVSCKKALVFPENFKKGEIYGRINCNYSKDKLVKYIETHVNKKNLTPFYVYFGNDMLKQKL